MGTLRCKLNGRPLSHRSSSCTFQTRGRARPTRPSTRLSSASGFCSSSRIRPTSRSEASSSASPMRPGMPTAITARARRPARPVRASPIPITISPSTGSLQKTRSTWRRQRHEDPSGPARFLLISASSRSEHTCPGEMSKSYRLVEIAQEVLANAENTEVEVLELSRLAAEYGRHIHPCKACFSTAAALCHWPCSCYPELLARADA